MLWHEVTRWGLNVVEIISCDIPVFLFGSVYPLFLGFYPSTLF